MTFDADPNNGGALRLCPFCRDYIDYASFVDHLEEEHGMEME